MAQKYRIAMQIMQMSKKCLTLAETRYNIESVINLLRVLASGDVVILRVTVECSVTPMCSR
jgi:hypothetical protein